MAHVDEHVNDVVDDAYDERRGLHDEDGEQPTLIVGKLGQGWSKDNQVWAFAQDDLWYVDDLVYDVLLQYTPTQP